MQSPKLRKAFLLAKGLGLTDEERLDLTNMILRPPDDITTWKALDEAQTDRMLDALEGATLVRHLLEERSEWP